MSMQNATRSPSIIVHFGGGKYMSGTPAYAVGAISLVALGLAIYALYGRRLAGGWRKVYVITALVANGVRLTRAEPIAPTLEDLYFAVRTKKSIADDGGRQLGRPPGADPASPTERASQPVTDRGHQVAALTGWPAKQGASR